MRTLLSRFDVRVSLAYGIVATLWILLSDSALVFLAGGNTSIIATVGALKGVGFMVVTTVALFVILRAELRKRDRLEEKLQSDVTERTHAVEALQQSESRFETIFHGSPVPTAITRLGDAHVVDVNDAWIALFGFDRDEIIGHTTIEVGLWAAPQQRTTVIDSLFDEHRVRNMVIDARTKSGAWITLVLSSDLIFLGGEPHAVSMFYDITEQKEIEEQRRYQALLMRNVSDAVISTDGDMKIRSWNPAAEMLYGWKAEEVIGKPIADIARGEHETIPQNEIMAELRTHGSWFGEVSQKRKDGSKVYVLASTSLVTNQAGNRLGLVSVNKDITERKQMELALRESEQRFRTMADTAPAMLWTTDTEGGATFLSRAWCDFTGQAEASGLGWGWMEMVHPEDRAGVVSRFREAIKSQTSVQIETRLWHGSTGEYRWVMGPGSPRYSEQGEFLGYIGSVMDVTERRQAQEDLRAAELLRMELDKERELLELKERFISIVSHEFRTPLSVIVFSAELMQQYYDQMPRERQVKHVHEIMMQGQFMVDLLDDVLTVNKARSGKLEFNPLPIDVVAFCEATLERMHAVDRGLHEFVFTHKGDLTHVILDEKLLQHILVNLLSNAVKYSPHGGDVHLDVTLENSDIVFRVSDEGIGIPPDNLVRLYEPFYRAENTGDISGTGLGTAIIKDSVDLHKGSILCESEVGVGTTFTVRLPTVPIAKINVPE
ncbi:MAG: PAS domain-containing sensor histidine kinase [Anaerolineae bacterium]|nr:PAS domain-containing sensor histidine kinase [Anaerolineae bacterium]